MSVRRRGPADRWRTNSTRRLLAAAPGDRRRDWSGHSPIRFELSFAVATPTMREQPAACEGRTLTEAQAVISSTHLALLPPTIGTPDGQPHHPAGARTGSESAGGPTTCVYFDPPSDQPPIRGDPAAVRRGVVGPAGAEAEPDAGVEPGVGGAPG